MAKGNKAKEYVAKKLAEVFGEDYIGEFDKKLYISKVKKYNSALYSRGQRK